MKIKCEVCEFHFKESEGLKNNEREWDKFLEEVGKTQMLMRKWARLRGKEHNLVKDLEETTLSFKKLGERYEVSRQAVQVFSKREGVKRPAKPKGHQTEGCRLCQKS